MGNKKQEQIFIQIYFHNEKLYLRHPFITVLKNNEVRYLYPDLIINKTCNI